MATPKKKSENTIIVNRKASHDYALSDRLTAGIALLGWEVKSIRAHKVQIRDGHIHIKQGEAWLIGATITPLDTVAQHTKPNPGRTRKLLLKQKEIKRLLGAVKQGGYTIVPLSLWWKKPYIKLDIALAKGKKLHDKRASAQKKDWSRQKQRLMKQQD